MTEAAKRYGWLHAGAGREPYRIEGKKTMGLEVVEQLGWDVPDAILYPTGGGVGIIGMWKVFDELEELGWIGSRRPRLVSVQVPGGAVVKAFHEGARRVPRREARGDHRARHHGGEAVRRLPDPARAARHAGGGRSACRTPRRSHHEVDERSRGAVHVAGGRGDGRGGAADGPRGPARARVAGRGVQHRHGAPLPASDGRAGAGGAGRRGDRRRGGRAGGASARRARSACSRTGSPGGSAE